MKKAIVLSLRVSSALLCNAQGPNTTGNYEFSISNDSKSITIKARNTTGTIRSSYVNPAINGNFVGLVFGINHFIQTHDNWFILEHDDIDPGMTVLVNKQTLA